MSMFRSSFYFVDINTGVPFFQLERALYPSLSMHFSFPAETNLSKGDSRLRNSSVSLLFKKALYLKVPEQFCSE